MAGETKIQGNAILFAVYDGSAYRPLACLTSSSVNKDVTINETETKCNPGVVEKDYGAVNTTIDVDGEFIDTTSVGGDTAKASYDYLESKLDAKEKVTIRYSTGLTDVATKYATALIGALTLTGDVNVKATFSATLEIDGGFSVTDPNA